METNTNRISKWDRVMMAIAFAEAGEYDTAQGFLIEEQAKKRSELRTGKSEQRPEIRA